MSWLQNHLRRGAVAPRIARASMAALGLLGGSLLASPAGADESVVSFAGLAFRRKPVAGSAPKGDA